MLAHGLMLQGATWHFCCLGGSVVTTISKCDSVLSTESTTVPAVAYFASENYPI
jgi:hypothetical protein